MLTLNEIDAIQKQVSDSTPGDKIWLEPQQVVDLLETYVDMIRDYIAAYGPLDVLEPFANGR